MLALKSRAAEVELNLMQVAALVGCHPVSLYKREKIQGLAGFPEPRKRMNRLVWTESEVLAWKEEQDRPRTKKRGKR